MPSASAVAVSSPPRFFHLCSACPISKVPINTPIMASTSIPSLSPGCFPTIIFRVASPLLPSMDRFDGHGMVSFPILRVCTWMDVPPHLPSSRRDVVRPRIPPWHASLGSFRFGFLLTLGSGSWGSDPGTDPRRTGWIPTACATLSTNILWVGTCGPNHLACVLLPDGKVVIVGDLS